MDPEWIIRVPGSLVGGGGRKKNKNVKGVGGTPGSSHANPIQKEEKIFPGGVMGSMESSRADTPGAESKTYWSRVDHQGPKVQGDIEVYPPPCPKARGACS